MTRPLSSHPRTEYVPMTLFGKDHWSTFAYIETRLVDNKGFMIACDARMRTLSHNHRIFNHRPDDNLQLRGSRQAMLAKREDNERYGTFVNDGSIIPSHDDWDCIQDLAAAGLLLGDATEEPLRVFDAISIENTDKRVAHDDYAARIQLAEFVRAQADFGLDLSARVYFTTLGFQVASALRSHKAKGGTFHTFRWPISQESI